MVNRRQCQGDGSRQLAIASMAENAGFLVNQCVETRRRSDVGGRGKAIGGSSRGQVAPSVQVAVARLERLAAQPLHMKWNPRFMWVSIAGMPPHRVTRIWLSEREPVALLSKHDGRQKHPSSNQSANSVAGRWAEFLANFSLGPLTVLHL